MYKKPILPYSFFGYFWAKKIGISQSDKFLDGELEKLFNIIENKADLDFEIHSNRIVGQEILILIFEEEAISFQSVRESVSESEVFELLEKKGIDSLAVDILTAYKKEYPQLSQDHIDYTFFELFWLREYDISWDFLQKT